MIQTEQKEKLLKVFVDVPGCKEKRFALRDF